MTQQTMMELANPFDAFAKHIGYVLVKYMTIGSSSSNPQFLVKVYHSGDLRTVDQNDLKEYGNPAAGEKLVPHIPLDWYTEEMMNTHIAKNSKRFMMGLPKCVNGRSHVTAKRPKLKRSKQ